MLFYLLLAGTLVVAGAGLTYVGLGLPAMALFYVFAAWYWARGRRPWSLGIVAAACAAGVIGGQALAPGLLLALYAGTGVVPGTALRRQWQYGETVAATTAAAFAILLAELALFWEAFKLSAFTARDAMVALSRMGNEGRVTADQQAVLDAANRMTETWPYLGVGAMFTGLLIGACMLTGGLRLALRRLGYVDEFPGSFVAMRPPDALVWAVIVATLLGYWDYQWPQETVRLLAWNGLLGLGAIYGLNGVGVLMHGIQALKAPTLLSAAAVVLVVIKAPYFMVLVGLFDTWGEFRARFDKLAHLRQVRKQQDDDSGY